MLFHYNLSLNLSLLGITYISQKKKNTAQNLESSRQLEAHDRGNSFVNYYPTLYTILKELLCLWLVVGEGTVKF